MLLAAPLGGAMQRGLLVLIVAAIFSAVALPARQAAADISAAQVTASIRLGVKYLRGRQDRVRGNWQEYSSQPGGLTSLITLALLNCGAPVDDPAIQRSLAYLRKLGNPEMTYATALQTLVFCEAEPDRDRLLIERNVAWLESSQLTGRGRSGAWGYSDRHGNGDNSNTQFALLALHEADRVGVKVKDQTWKKSLDYWLSTQKKDGSWGYVEDRPSTGSMTCAAITSVIISSGRVSGSDSKVSGDDILCCTGAENNDAVERAFQWLGKYFSVRSNPTGLSARGRGQGRNNLLYYLYGVERVGRLSGRRFIGKHDWYREGAEVLVGSQDKLTGFWKGVGLAEDNPLIATALSLLFLSKGARPVVVSRMIHSQPAGVLGGETRGVASWNRHRHALQNLTYSVGKRWKQNLTWQTVDPSAASVEDLLQTPVLFISGSDKLDISVKQQKLLRQYVDQGGFIFAEACCEGDGFDRDFRKLMKAVFPESPMRLLPYDHPVWFAERKVPAEHLRPLWGVEACCRTSVVYCPASLSCYWELEPGGRDAGYAAKPAQEIDAAVAIGQNVLAYATNRRLKPKLREPTVAVSSGGSELSRNTIIAPKVAHNGGSDDAPNAWSNLLQLAGEQLPLRLSRERRMAAPADPTLFNYPLLFMHGRRTFRFSAPARKALAEYLSRGGVLFVDSICASEAFAASVRQEVKEMFPGKELKRLPASHSIFTSKHRGHQLTTVSIREPGERVDDGPLLAKITKVKPRLEGLEIDGRLAVIFSPLDISCAMENTESLECKGYIKADAARLGVNVILYALQQ